MTKLAITCWEPVQAHTAMTMQVWPALKSMLLAGSAALVLLADGVTL